MDVVTLGAAKAAAARQAGHKLRRGVYLTGCNGTTTTTTNSGGVGSLRLVARLPVAPSRFRIKLRNYDTVAGTTQASITGKGLKIGLNSVANDGFETGSVKDGALTTLVGTDFTIPGNGTWYTSPWVEPATYQIPQNRNIVIAYGYDAGGAITFPRGVGQAWHTTDLTMLTGATAGPGTPMANTPMEMQIEYEWAGAQRQGLFIGDSISEGLGGMSSLGNVPFMSWPALWASRNDAVAVNLGVSGSQTGNWNGITGRYWTRVDLSVIAPDFAFISLGANDANNSTSLATYQTNMIAIAAQLRTLYGEELPIYLGNVTPRGLEPTVKEPLRLSYNGWLENLPLRALACFDFDAAVRDPADNTRILGAPTANTIYNYDGTHFTRRGYNKMAQAVGRLTT